MIFNESDLSPFYLEKVAGIDHFSKSFLGELLLDFYKGSENLGLLATLLNSIFYEKKITFILDYPRFVRMVRSDPNSTIGFKLSPETYLEFLKTLHLQRMIKTWKTLDSFSPELGPFIGGLSHKFLLPYAHRHIGGDHIFRQKNAVIRLTDAFAKFDQQEETISFTPEKSNNDILEGVKQKAREFGLLKGTPKLKTRPEKNLTQLENEISEQKSLYQSMLDQAKNEETMRLNTDIELPEQNHRAIMAGVKASWQKKKVEELELRFLRLKQERSEKTKKLHNETQL
ncbi:hypothetical protein OAB57_01735 [Bacteriovoracaceae bacterium]|nr:hypothetical protein [Bacteriovoracaceae bacterium]